MSKPGLFSLQQTSITLAKPKPIPAGVACTTLYVDDALLTSALEDNFKCAFLNAQEEQTVNETPELPPSPGAPHPPTENQQLQQNASVENVPETGKLRGVLQLRKLLQTQMQQARDEQFDFEYRDRNDRYTEFCEYFDAEADVSLFHEGSLALEKLSGDISKATTFLDSADKVERVDALKAVFFSCLGGSALEDWQQREKILLATTSQLLENNVFQNVCKLLASSLSTVGEFLEDEELSLLLNVVYLVTHCQVNSNMAADALFGGDQRPTCVFQKCTAFFGRLCSSPAPLGPAGQRLLLKLSLLISEMLHCLQGTNDTQESLKIVAARVLGLTPEGRGHASRYNKAKLADYHDYMQHMIQRYPQFWLNDARELLRKRHPDLPNPELYAELPSPLVSLFGASATFSKSHVTSFPFYNANLPLACREAVATFEKHLYLSASAVQWHQELLIHRRSQSDGFMMAESIARSYPASKVKSNFPHLNESVQRWERLGVWYQGFVPSLPKFVADTVGLLYRVNVESNSSESLHSRLLTKASLSILFKLLRVCKRWHICAFENVARLLMDCNSAVLILKLLGQWFSVSKENSSGFLKEKFTEPLASDTVSKTFLSAISKGSLDGPKPEQQQSKLKGNFNMFFCSITSLIILHKMTKNKHLRLQKLVQWKSSVILKKSLKVQNLSLHLYSLKLLGEQLPYLPKKWKQSNMRIVTAYYLHCRPSIGEDWLRNRPGMTSIEALEQEETCRDIVMSWHQRKGYTGDSSSHSHR